LGQIDPVGGQQAEVQGGGTQAEGDHLLKGQTAAADGEAGQLGGGEQLQGGNGGGHYRGEGQREQVADESGQVGADVSQGNRPDIWPGGGFKESLPQADQSQPHHRDEGGLGVPGQ
jgi:hypothetical protein